MRYVIVVDMQRDFVTGPLGSPEAQEAANQIIKRIPEYNDGNTRVIFTQDTHYNDTYDESIEGQKLPVKHCIITTPGWEVIPEITEALKDFPNCNILPYVFENHIQKETFGSLDLINALYENEDAYGMPVEEIIIVGVCTDICVVSNCLMLKAAFPNVPIKIIDSCCAGTTIENHNAAMRTMSQCHIDIIP